MLPALDTQATDALIILYCLLLVVVANGAPVLARYALGDRFRRPVDGGIRYRDRRPLLGASKTIRGVVAAVLATALVAPLVGLPPGIGALVGICAMAGDLFSSFVKRRLGLPPGRVALGLDEVPESLFPLLVLQAYLDLSLPQVLVTVAFFVVLHAVSTCAKAAAARLSLPERIAIVRETARSALWAPLAVFFAHVLISVGFDGYQKVPELDIPMHLLGGMAIVLFFSRLLDILADHGIVARVDNALRAILLLALTAAAAVLWEFAEFTSDHSFGTRAQQGLADTMFDLFLGLLGGFTMVSLLLLAKHRGGRTGA